MTLVDPESSARIDHNVLEELAWGPHGHEREMGVEVDAERTGRHLTGVTNVVNKITVSALTSTSESVARAIERALERRAERHARRIGVEVHDGIVTLTGSVYSWSERRSVLGAARSAPGVHLVEDRLWPEE
jgi:osmotically-inducible protein OsmY